MAFAADPGGIFASDAHRQVLGHLSHPEDDYGWQAAALYARVGAIGVDQAEFMQILADLEASGHAEQPGGAWRMTQNGFAAISGPIANEPPPGSPVIGPAMVAAATPIARSEQP